jgi:hypothetical protein
VALHLNLNTRILDWNVDFMDIVAAIMKVDDVPCVVVQVEPQVVEDQRLTRLMQGLLAKCVEIEGLPTVLASKRNELAEPNFFGQPNLVRRLQTQGWGNIPFNNCKVSLRA